ncbi:MAG: T9SS type A sorting domain-containing protein [Bacteroidia bacterium]|nr:T9SS type A sorting domain-containing protein [Bacteroidia bacterium]MBP7256886.1 T9SS type A sorting domain-containing protein [Chitinophagales bacterium]
MMNRIKILAILLIAFTSQGNAQTAPFHIAIEPMNISGLGGLQAYAWGQHNGKWLIIGGRLDGLHRRQPFAAFDVAGHNNQLIVVDPVAQQKWTAPLSSLPIGLQEQLSSTNMEFFQEGNYLYLVGGYGYSNTSADHITYPNLSAVKVPDVINAVINGTSFATNFRQITDTMFAVTGGYLNKINNTFYLTGGQKFIGRYNPMGPTHGPGFVQIYTNASRKFTIFDNGVTLSVTHLPAIVDAANLHRRDYNVVPQIMPTGQEGLTAFSGVFQVGVDLPYLNCVNIDSTGHTVNNAFSQYYNHYHCAHIPIYSASNNEMHTVFFGGIAQYYDSLGILVQDNNVPFVKTIARVTRDASGTMAEYKLPIAMPTLLGAGSEFIPINTLPHYSNEVFKLDNFTADTTLVGYIYGGISSTAANIFFTNTGTQSSASSQIFKVFVIKNSTVGIHELNTHSIGTLQMQVYPNPNNGNFMVKFNLRDKGEVKLTISDASGKLIENTVLKNLQAGENTYSKRIKNLINGGIYYITIETTYEKATQKIIVEP